MTQLIGVTMIFMSTFILGGVFFIKIEELNKLVGVKETLLTIAILFLLGTILLCV